MAFNLTAKTRSILNQIQKNPSLTLDIEGIDVIYSSSAVLKRVTWDGGFFWDSGIFWDSSAPSNEFISYIDLNQSTKVIGQQIYPDKDGASSISTIQVSIIDKDGSVSKKLALNSITEILGKKTEVALGFVGADYSDFMPIMNGFIVDYYYKSGTVNITISHSDALRKQSVLTSSTTELDGALNASDLVFNLVDASGIVLPSEEMNSYLAIDDEIMQISSVSGNQVTLSQRGVLGSVGTSHDDEAEVRFTYLLTGFPLDLAQKIMLSSAGNEYFTSDYIVSSTEFVSPTLSINNAFIINTPNIERESGLIIGDFIKVDTYGEFTINSFGTLDNGNSYIVVNENIASAEDLELNLQFKSKYNVLNFGLGMLPFEVDNAEFENVKTNFSPNFTEMEFYIDEGIENVRDFVNKQLYFVAGCYGIPKNARTSVKFLSPPLSDQQLPTLNETNILNLIDLKPMRSINKFYYNDVLYSYNKSFLDGEFKAFNEYLDADSIARFKVGKKQLVIESDGLRRNTATVQAINRLASRFLDRYNQGATYIKGVKLPFKSGFNLQVGDVVLFGGDGVLLPDYNTGTRKLPLAKYEIINQQIDLSGTITIDILSTGFLLEGTFAKFSPSSYVSSATTTSIKLKRFNTASGFNTEREKWESLVGIKIRVRSENFSYDEVTTLTGLDTQDINTIIVDALPTAPLEDYIIEFADYDLQSDYGTNEVTDKMKLTFTFTMPQVTVTTATDGTIFEVSDVSQLKVGDKIAVHSPDFSRDNLSTTILDITGSQLTVNDIGFTPLADDLVEFLTNEDGFDGYLLL